MKPTIRPFFVCIFSIGIAVVPAFAQRTEPRSSRAVVVSREHSTVRKAGSLRAGSIGPRALATSQPQATVPPPAPGVVQVFVNEGNIFATFIATSSIPQTATFGGSLSSDNGSQITFDNVQFNSAMIPGDFVQLPQFSNAGDLFPQGTITYTVDVTINNQLTESNAQFFLGSPRVYSDLQSLTPILYTTAQSIASNNDMMLAIKGLFGSGTPLVVLGSFDQGNFVVPAAAVKGVTSSEIDVDLSQVRGLDLSTLNEYELTVSQAGFADTLRYRYVPAAPKTFNLAPQ